MGVWPERVLAAEASELSAGGDMRGARAASAKAREGTGSACCGHCLGPGWPEPEEGEPGGEAGDGGLGPSSAGRPGRSLTPPCPRAPGLRVDAPRSRSRLRAAWAGSGAAPGRRAWPEGGLAWALLTGSPHSSLLALLRASPVASAEDAEMKTQNTSPTQHTRSWPLTLTHTPCTLTPRHTHTRTQT